MITKGHPPTPVSFLMGDWFQVMCSVNFIGGASSSMVVLMDIAGKLFTFSALATTGLILFCIFFFKASGIMGCLLG
jgi:hypothetical protein